MGWIVGYNLILVISKMIWFYVPKSIFSSKQSKTVNWMYIGCYLILSLCARICVRYLCIPLKRRLCWMEHSCRREWLPLLWEQPSMRHSKDIHTGSSGKGIKEQIVLGHLSLHILYVSGNTDSCLWGRPQRWQKEKLCRHLKGPGWVFCKSKPLTQ